MTDGCCDTSPVASAIGRALTAVMNAAGERGSYLVGAGIRALWCWIYRAADQFFAGLTHWNVGAAGGGADVSGRGE